MWCHICKRGFTKYEDFKVHIMKVHREASDYEDDSESDSEDDDDVITAADHDSEEDDDISNYVDTDLNAYISINTDNNTSTNINTNAIVNTYTDTNIDTNGNAITYTDDKLNTNTSTAASKDMKKALSKAKLNVAKKLKAKSLKHNKLKVKSRPALQLKSTKGKYPLRKSARVQRKSSYQEDDSSDDDISPPDKKATKKNKEQTVKTESVLGNDQENKNIVLINPVIGQGVNNYVVGNQGVQQPMFVINPMIQNTGLDSIKSFDFTSDNVLKWLYKYRDMTRTLKFPLPQSLFDHIKMVHKGIFDCYCLASSGEETQAVMKVYEDLNHMIHRHILAINEKL